MSFGTPSTSADALSTAEPSPTPQAETNTAVTGAVQASSLPTETSSAHSEVSVASSNPTSTVSAGATPRPHGAAGPASPAEFPKFSATTEEILQRIRSTAAATSMNKPGYYEAARESVMKSMATSDRINTTPGTPAPRGRKPGVRGGARGSPLVTNGDGTGSEVATPEASNRGSARGTGSRGRGSGRGRGRGRGRGGSGGTGVKRKREGSAEEDDDASDDSVEIVAPSTQTRSGRQVAKPTVYVPTIASPSTGNKRKRVSTKKKEEVCFECKRPTSVTGNLIVFCDTCNTPYHQFCHIPPIGKEVTTDADKAWSCTKCTTKKKPPAQPPVPLFPVNGESSSSKSESLVAAPDLTPDERRKYFSSLPHGQLVSLLVNATTQQPTLHLFTPNPRSKITSSKPPASTPASSSKPLNTLDPKSSSSLSSPPSSSPHRPTAPAPTSAPTTIPPNPDFSFDDEDTGHFPKPGHGLALPPEPDDLQYLVDDEQFPFFTHRDSYADGVGVGTEF